MEPRLLNAYVRSPMVNKIKLAMVKKLDEARFGPEKKLSYDEIVQKLSLHENSRWNVQAHEDA